KPQKSGPPHPNPSPPSTGERGLWNRLLPFLMQGSAMNAPITLAPAAVIPAVQEDRFYEVVNGQRVELPPMSAYEVRIASVLMVLLENHVKTHTLGRAVSEMLFLLDAARDLQRQPDVAFVSYDRWVRGRRVPRTSAWEVVPDLAIEVVSPT